MKEMCESSTGTKMTTMPCRRRRPNSLARTMLFAAAASTFYQTSTSAQQNVTVPAEPPAPSPTAAAAAAAAGESTPSTPITTAAPSILVITAPLLPTAAITTEAPVEPTTSQPTTTKVPTTSPTLTPSAQPTTQRPTSSPTITHQPTTTRYPTATPTSSPSTSKNPTFVPTATPTTSPTSEPTPVRSSQIYPYAKMSILGLGSLPDIGTFEYWSTTTSEWIEDWWAQDLKVIIGPDGNEIVLDWQVRVVHVDTYDVTQQVEKGSEVGEDIVEGNVGGSPSGPGGRNSFGITGGGMGYGNETTNSTTNSTDNGGGGGRLLRRKLKTKNAFAASRFNSTWAKVWTRSADRRRRRVQSIDPILSINTLTYSQTIYYYYTTNDTDAISRINAATFATYPFLSGSDRDRYLNKLKSNDPTAETTGTFQNLKGSTPVQVSDVPFTEMPTFAPTPVPPEPSPGLSGGAIAGIIIAALVTIGAFGAWYVFRPVPGDDDTSANKRMSCDDNGGQMMQGWEAGDWANDGSGAPLYYGQQQAGGIKRNSSKLAQKLSKRGLSGSGSDQKSSTRSKYSAESISNMSLRPFAPVKKQGSGSLEGEERPQDVSALSEDMVYEEGDEANHPELDDSVSAEDSDLAGQFGPHMLRVQEIEDMQ